MVRQPNQVLSNVSATVDSEVIHDMDCKSYDMRRNVVVMDIRDHTGTPTARRPCRRVGMEAVSPARFA